MASQRDLKAEQRGEFEAEYFYIMNSAEHTIDIILT